MIGALATLLVLQLLGEALVYVFKLPLPGPVVGMALLLVVLAVRPRQLAALKPTAQNLLQHLSLLFVPAGVGVVGNLDVLAAEAGVIAVALVASTVATLVVSVVTFRLVARLMGDR